MGRSHSGTVTVLAAAALALVIAPTASADPEISGGDQDVWNLANPVPTYEIESNRGRGGVFWDLAGVGSGFVDSGETLRFAGLADGSYTLRATEAFRFRPDAAERTFRVDLTAPGVTVLWPAAGAQIPQGSTATAIYNCTGAIICDGSVGAGARLDTSRAGAASFSVRAVDDAGNEATSLVEYTVVQRASSAAVAGGSRSINARALTPRVGVTITGRRPVLRWRARAGARLYNVQVFRLRGTTATKVLSAFPRRNRLRVPAGRLVFGGSYLWRVWPHVGGRYLDRPLGLSYFDVRAAPTRSPS